MQVHPFHLPRREEAQESGEGDRRNGGDDDDEEDSDLTKDFEVLASGSARQQPVKGVQEADVTLLLTWKDKRADELGIVASDDSKALEKDALTRVANSTTRPSTSSLTRWYMSLDQLQGTVLVIFLLLPLPLRPNCATR